jgi:hypothetical protein
MNLGTDAAKLVNVEIVQATNVLPEEHLNLTGFDDQA